MSNAEQNNALTVHDGGQQPAPKPPRAPLTAGNIPRAIVPVDFDGAYRIANVVTQAGMAPKTLQTVEKAMVAILHGLEVGLTPMNALQSIAVINGRPTIWGDGAIGLIRASGLLEWMEEKYEGEGDKLVAVCIVKRKGEPKPVRGEFSWQDAKKANLLAKDGPWQTYPRRMLQMRARWPLRDVFADVLKGLSIREEVEDLERSRQPDAIEEQPRRRVPSPPADEPVAETVATEPAVETENVIDEYTGEVIGTVPKQAKADPISSGPIKADDGFPGDKPMVKHGHHPDPMEVDTNLPLRLDRNLTDPEREWILACDEAFAECTDVDSLRAEQESVMLPSKDSVSEHAWARAVAIVKQHVDRITQ
jgi:hypothetical protein